MIEDSQKNEVKYSLILIACENGVGSLLHFFHIPFAGHFLSINQLGILARLSLSTKKTDSALLVSTTTALIKSLGPIGKKLTPMIAILFQGLIFSIPLTLMGVSYFSILVGVVLSSFWAFVQPLLILYVLMGKSFIDVLNYIGKDLEHISVNYKNYLIGGVLVLILIKTFATIAYSWYLMNLNEVDFEKLNDKIASYKKQNIKKRIKFPFYILLVSFISIVFLYYNESNWVSLIWLICRPMAIGLILYLAIKLITLERIVLFFNKIKFKKLAKIIQETTKGLDKLR